MKWFLGLIIQWLPLSILILVILILDGWGSNSPQPKGDNSVGVLFFFCAVCIGVGLLFWFNHSLEHGGFLDRWLDKILQPLNIKLKDIIRRFPRKLPNQSVEPIPNISQDKILTEKHFERISQMKKYVAMKKMFSKKNITKLLLIFALFLCLLKMPYWYFQLFSIFGTIGFVYMAYLDYNLKIKYTPQIFIALAIIINPVIKISFDRDTWIIIDIILAVIILCSFYENLIIRKINKLSE